MILAVPLQLSQHAGQGESHHAVGPSVRLSASRNTAPSPGGEKDLQNALMSVGEIHWRTIPPKQYQQILCPIKKSSVNDALPKPLPSL